MGRVGVSLQPDDDLSLLTPYVDKLDLIAIHFPKFTDGRGYSLARLLRQRLGYRGELRAVGEVLRDQLYFMARCGFDAFELRDSYNPEAALSAFTEITVHYQAAADGYGPAYRMPLRQLEYPLPVAAG